MTLVINNDAQATKKIPPISKYWIDDKPKKEQTPDEMVEVMKSWTAALGGRFVVNE
jgi:hypothetical protein